MRSAHSRINLTEIASRPVSFDSDILFIGEKTILLLVGVKLNLLLQATTY